MSSDPDLGVYAHGNCTDKMLERGCKGTWTALSDLSQTLETFKCQHCRPWVCTEFEGANVWGVFP